MSKSVGFEEENTYIDSKVVAHNRKPLNEVLDKTTITLTMKERRWFNYTSPWTFIRVPFDIDFGTIGPFTFSNGIVKINKNMDVIVSGQITFINAPQGEVDILLSTKNRGGVVSSFDYGPLSLRTIFLTPRKLSLVAGDEIGMLYGFGGTTDSFCIIGDGEGAGTCLTIQEI